MRIASTILLALLIAAISVSAQSNADSSVVAATDSVTVIQPVDSSLAARVLALAQQYLGTPYRYGSDTKHTRTFDCSGFVCHCYGSCNVSLPHGSGSQAQLCETIKLSEVQPGDLLFFKGRNAKSQHIGHVSLVLEVNDGKIKMIHATHRGVVVDVYQESDYYTKRFVKAGRLKPHLTAGR